MGYISRREVSRHGNCSKCNSITDSLLYSRAIRICPIPKRIVYTFFCTFPPARFYSNALRGIAKLQLLNEEVFDSAKDGAKIERAKAGIIRQNNVGFRELAQVLTENKAVEGKIQQISLLEQKAGIRIGKISPETVKVLLIGKDGKQDVIRTDPFEPNKPIRELTNWVENKFRRQLAYWMIALVVIWLGANSYMLYLLKQMIFSYVTAPTHCRTELLRGADRDLACMTISESRQ